MFKTFSPSFCKVRRNLDEFHDRKQILQNVINLFSNAFRNSYDCIDVHKSDRTNAIQMNFQNKTAVHSNTFLCFSNGHLSRIQVIGWMRRGARAAARGAPALPVPGCGEAPLPRSTSLSPARKFASVSIDSDTTGGDGT